MLNKNFLDSLNLPLKISISFSVFLFFFIFTQKIYVQAIGFIEKNFLDSKTVIVKDVVIKVRIADSESERVKGLSNTKKLEDHEGMLFVFDYEDLHGFWMKDMNYPIDIIWFDKDKKVVDYVLNVSPSTYPTIFKPQSKALYVLEVQSGFVDIHDLKKGNYIAI